MKNLIEKYQKLVKEVTGRDSDVILTDSMNLQVELCDMMVKDLQSLLEKESTDCTSVKSVDAETFLRSRGLQFWQYKQNGEGICLITLLQDYRFQIIKEAEKTISLLEKENQLNKNDLLPFVMPRKLTAENGAKSLLIGEFAECFDPEDCGNPYVVPISWDSIKRIYDKIVSHYGA